MKNIYIYWFKLSNGNANFGDEIGPFIVSKLSGLKTVFISPNKKYLYRELINSISKNQNKYSFSDIFNILLGKKRILVSAGSILSHYSSRSCDIWGSGIISKNSRVNNANFLAVRGKYTQIRLGELGYDIPNAIGDPALLLPVVLPTISRKKYKLGIIPHYVHYEEVRNMFNSPNILVINLLEPNIVSIVKKINSCNVTISTSLHGIIVSHAYKIPSLWYNLNDKPLFGDDIKFDDYFSSVGINNYKPFLLPETDNIDELLDKVVNTINTEKSINSIQIDLKEIQKNLLNSAPFQLKDKFQSLIND